MERWARVLVVEDSREKLGFIQAIRPILELASVNMVDTGRLC